MPRQTFLSKEFFVNASEKEAKEHILSIPGGVTNIKFVAEDSVRHTMKFIYEQWSAEAPNCINVSLLPLNVSQTRVSLHGSTNNGAAFYEDVQVANALSNFELAVQAAVQGTISNFQPIEVKQRKQLRVNVVAVIALVAGLLYVIKNWLV